MITETTIKGAIERSIETGHRVRLAVESPEDTLCEIQTSDCIADLGFGGDDAGTMIELAGTCDGKQFKLLLVKA